MTGWIPEVSAVEIAEGKIYVRSGKEIPLRRPIRKEVIEVSVKGPAMGDLYMAEGELERASIYTLPSICHYFEGPTRPAVGRPFGKVLKRGPEEQYLACQPKR